MTDIHFSARPNVFTPEQVFRLEGDSLICNKGGNDERLALADVVQVRLFGSPGMVSRGVMVMPASTICKLRVRDGSKRTIGSIHYRGVGQIENRSDSYTPFIDALLPGIAAANPSAVFLAGMPTGLWILWIGVLFITFAVAILGLQVGMTAALRQDWIETALGVLMVLSFGYSTLRLFRLVVRGRSRPFTPTQA